MQHQNIAGNASARPIPQTIDDNAALALVLDPTIQPEDLAPRMGLSLIQLAAWARDHAPQLTDLKEFFTTRATLIAARLHMSSLAALDRVINLAKDPDAKTQERARRAASTILRNLAPPTARKAPNPPAKESAAQQPQTQPNTPAARPSPQANQQSNRAPNQSSNQPSNQHSKPAPNQPAHNAPNNAPNRAPAPNAAPNPAPNSAANPVTNPTPNPAPSAPNPARNPSQS
jgi:hypothetical protein